MILGIVQARMSSSRLPGKVLEPILGEPMLWRQLERVQRAIRIEKLIVATSTDGSDDAIAAACARWAVPCFRGALADVLDRYYRAAAAHGPAQYVVRLTADCPLADWRVIDACIDLHWAENTDYTSNTIMPSYPDGLDVEVMTQDALGLAWREATAPDEREHVTSYLYRRPDRFRLGKLFQDRDLSHLRWTVDTPADFEFVSAVYAALYPLNPSFVSEDVLRYQGISADIWT